MLRFVLRPSVLLLCTLGARCTMGAGSRAACCDFFTCPHSWGFISIFRFLRIFRRGRNRERRVAFQFFAFSFYFLFILLLLPALQPTLSHLQFPLHRSWFCRLLVQQLLLHSPPSPILKRLPLLILLLILRSTPNLTHPLLLLLLLFLLLPLRYPPFIRV